MVFYHGTNSELLGNINQEGLFQPYLTDSMELAEYYAEATDGDGDPVILQVIVRNPGLLEPDRPSLAEPVGYGSILSEKIEEQLKKMRSRDLERWEKTLPITRTVRYNGIISPSDIRLIDIRQ